MYHTRFWQNIRRSTSFLTRRHARHGPRHARKHWAMRPLMRRGRSRRRARESLGWLVTPPFLFALFSIVVVTMVEPNAFLNDLMWVLLFGSTSLVLAVRSATANAPVFWRGVACALSVAYPVFLVVLR